MITLNKCHPLFYLDDIGNSINNKITIDKSNRTTTKPSLHTQKTPFNIHAHRPQNTKAIRKWKSDKSAATLTPSLILCLSLIDSKFLRMCFSFLAISQSKTCDYDFFYTFSHKCQIYWNIFVVYHCFMQRFARKWHQTAHTHTHTKSSESSILMLVRSVSIIAIGYSTRLKHLWICRLKLQFSMRFAI